MRFPLFLFLIVVATSPVTKQDRLSGKLMETLFYEPGAGKAAMYPDFFPAALGNRCNAGILRNFQRRTEAASVGSHRSQQTRRQGRAGPREAAENLRIRMFLENLLDSLVKLRDGIK